MLTRLKVSRGLQSIARTQTLTLQRNGAMACLGLSEVEDMKALWVVTRVPEFRFTPIEQDQINLNYANSLQAEWIKNGCGIQSSPWFAMFLLGHGEIWGILLWFFLFFFAKDFGNLTAHCQMYKGSCSHDLVLGHEAIWNEAWNMLGTFVRGSCVTMSLVQRRWYLDYLWFLDPDAKDGPVPWGEVQLAFRNMLVPGFRV